MPRIASVDDEKEGKTVDLSTADGLADGSQPRLKSRSARWLKIGSARTGSLIPADKTYAEQLGRFEHQCAAAGIHRVHGFRHQYAQVRYRELTGWAAPAAGGPRSRELTAEQKGIDREARLTISAELGHEREQVTAVYLGR